MRIQHNIMAMNAYRNYNTNTSALSKNLEKLSSGYKINRAGDDAAGLAISEKMRAQITGLNAAQKNVKDGISLVKTAEGAMQEIQDMLNRMDYLATQSANGTYDDPVDRMNLQKEVEALQTEINRIADSANFNGIKLLDGSLDPDSTAATDAQAAADAAQAEADAALAAVATTTGEIVFGAETKATLPAQATNNTPGTGITANDRVEETILETDYEEAPQPGFSLSFDGITHVFKDVTDNTATDGDAKNITVSIGGEEITISEKYLADYVTAQGGTPKNGGTVDSETLAGCIAEKLGGTFTDSNSKTYNVSVEGDTIRFEATDPNQSTALNFQVGFNGVTQAPIAATKGKYTLTNYTAGTGSGDVTFEVKATLEDGTEATFNVGTDAALKSDSNTAAVVAALKDAKATIDGKEVKLSDYFDITNTGNAISFEAKTAGADKGMVTSVTLTDTETTAANAASFATGTPTSTEGVDKYQAGTTGHFNDGSLNIVSPGTAKIDQLASTVIDLTSHIEDGAAIRLGDETYIFAVGDDSAYKDVENAVYVEGLKDTDTDFLEKITNKLTEVAANNKTFSVGQNKTDGHVTLKQLSSVKDSTDMSTMDNLGKYIGLLSVDEAKTAENTAAAKAEAQAKADELQATADKLAEAAKKAVNGKSLTLQIGDTSDDFNQMQVAVGDMHVSAMGAGKLNEGTPDEKEITKTIAEINIGTQDGAHEAIDVIKNAINYVSGIRGDLGAVQNRLEHTANNLSVMAENIQDAESTIRDTDIAEEMMSYTKNNILVQSAQAMLAQANAVPQGVLQLLG